MSAKRHFDATPEGATLSKPLCGWIGGRVTTDPDAVTCKLCSRKLHALREQERAQAQAFEGEYVDDTDFLEATREPLPAARPLTRAEAAIWRHVLDGVARAVSGDTDQRRARLRPETRFRSVSHALAELVATRVHGYGHRSLSEPQRLQAQAGLLGRSDGGPPNTHEAMRQAEDLHEVDYAWRHAFEGPWDGWMDERDCREAMLRRYVGDEGPTAIAQDLSERFGYRLKPKRIARIARDGYGRVWEYLAERGLIPKARR